ncbi:MAG: aminopeptidase [Deltaproteobacteria bacterium]|nr:aminopeptidase [Deltaproteobacteria bacterium]
MALLKKKNHTNFILGMILGVGTALGLVAGQWEEIPYYWQGAKGQWEILSHSRPILEVLEDPAVTPKEKERLKVVLQAQAVAISEMDYPDDIGYTTYAKLDRPQVSWVVVASHPLAIKAYLRCYPVLGCLSYRGYFKREEAEAFARELDSKGYDTFIRPVQAYSTLGWFEDPVVSPMLEGSALDLVRTVIHEQGHRIVFAPGDTNFNESFASFLELEGTRRYLNRLNDPRMKNRLAAQVADEQRFQAILERGRAKLISLYAADLGVDEKRSAKQQIFREMVQDYQNQKKYFKVWVPAGWFKGGMNNAHLVALGQYTTYVQAFAALLKECGGDFPRFYIAAQKLAQAPPDQRAARLDLLNTSQTTAHDG